MPEGSPEGFNPDELSAEYTPTEQEHVGSAIGLAAENTDRGSVQKDAEGRVVLRTETWDTTTQVTQLEHRANGSRHESGKLTAHAETDQIGKTVEREYPNEPAHFSLGGLGEGVFQGTVESYGWTSQQTDEAQEKINIHNADPDNADNQRDPREPWLKIVSTDPGLLAAVRARLRPEDVASVGDRQYARLRGDFGAIPGLDVGPQLLNVTKVGRLDVDISSAGAVTKVTLSEVKWSEA